MSYQNKNTNFQQINRQGALQTGNAPSPSYGHFPNSQIRLLPTPPCKSGHLTGLKNPYHHYTPTASTAPQNWHTNPYPAQQYANQAAPARNIHSFGLYGMPYYQNPSMYFSTMMDAHNIQQLQTAPNYQPFHNEQNIQQFQNAQNYQQFYNAQDIQDSHNTQNISYTHFPQTTHVASHPQPTGDQIIDQMWDEVLQNSFDLDYPSGINFNDIDWDSIPAELGYTYPEALHDSITQAPYGQPTPQTISSDSPQCLENHHGTAGYDEQASHVSSRPSPCLDQCGFPPTPQSVNDVQSQQPAPSRSPDIHQPTPISSMFTGIPSVIEACVTPSQTQSQVSTDRQISQDPEVQIVSERELPVQQESISLLEDEESSSKSATPPQRSPSRPVQRFEFSQEDLALEQAFKDARTRNKFIRAEIHATSRSKTGGDARNVRWWQVRAGKATQKPYFKTDPEAYRHAHDKQSYQCRHQGPSDSQIRNCIKRKCQHECCKSGVSRASCIMWIHALERQWQKDHPDYEFVYGPTGSETRARFQVAKESVKAVATLVGMGTNEDKSADEDLEADMLAALEEQSNNDDLGADLNAALEEDSFVDQGEPVNVEKAADTKADVAAPAPEKENDSLDAQEDEDYDSLFDDEDDEDEGGIPIEIDIVDPEACEPAGRSAEPQHTRQNTSANGLSTNIEREPIVGEKRAREESSEDDQQPPSKAARFSDPSKADGSNLIQTPVPVPAARHHEPIVSSQKNQQQSNIAQSQPLNTANTGRLKSKKRALSDGDDEGSSSAAPPASPPAKKQKLENPAPGSDNDFGIDKNVENYRDPAFPKGYMCGHRAFNKLENCLSGTCGGLTGQKSHQCCIQGLDRAAAKKMILNKLRSCRRKAEKENGGKSTKTQVTANVETPTEPSTSSSQGLNAPSSPSLENSCAAPAGNVTIGPENPVNLNAMDADDMALYEALKNGLESGNSAEQAPAEQYTVPDAVYDYESSSESEEE